MGRVGGGEAGGWVEDLNVLVILTQRSQGTKKCPWRPKKLPDLRTNRNQQKNRWKYYIFNSLIMGDNVLNF